MKNSPFREQVHRGVTRVLEKNIRERKKKENTAVSFHYERCAVLCTTVSGQKRISLGCTAHKEEITACY